LDNSRSENFKDLGVDALHPELDNQSKSLANSEFQRKVGLVDETTTKPLQVFVLPPHAYHVGRIFSVQQFLKLGKNKGQGSVNKNNINNKSI